MIISITTGSSVSDPRDLCPILVGLDDGSVHLLATVGWRIRLAIWFIRRYVQNCVS